MLKQPLTFEQLPAYIYELGQKVDLLIERLSQPVVSAPPDDLLTVREAAAFLDLAIATIYGLVYEKRIPFSKPNGRLYFSRAELLEWVKNDRRATTEELSEQARQQLATRLKRRHRSKQRLKQ